MNRWIVLLPVVVLLAGCSASYDELSSGPPREVLVTSNGWDDVIPGDLTKACLPDTLDAVRWDHDHNHAVVTCLPKGEK